VPRDHHLWILRGPMRTDYHRAAAFVRMFAPRRWAHHPTCRSIAAPTVRSSYFQGFPGNTIASTF
jgi:hypothetical protein